MAQSDFFIPNEHEQALIDRLSVKQLLETISTEVKPYERSKLVAELEDVLTNKSVTKAQLSEADRYNISRMLSNSEEWVRDTTLLSQRRPFFKHFFKTASTFYYEEHDGLSIHLNPVVGYYQGFDGSGQNLFTNSRGFTARGKIHNKIGFQLYLTDNQEVNTAYVYDWMIKQLAIPGIPTFKDYKGKGVDYFDSRASFNFAINKHFHLHSGFDKISIGNGYRSLVLSEQASSTLFVKLSGRYKKLSYYSVLMELFPGTLGRITGVYPRNYMKMNYVAYQLSKAVNVGVFHATVYGQKDKFHALYLLPFVNLHPGKTAAIDNELAGLDMRINLWKKAQVYGQLVVDDAVKTRADSGLISRYAFQVGLKYPDALGVQNLDLQLELNRIRPFTYTSSDSVSNYTQANQALAHPLGANLNEVIAIARYQPLNKLTFRALTSFYYQGKDTLDMNYGGNIFRSNLTGIRPSLLKTGAGNQQRCLNMILSAAYQVIPNLYAQAAIQYRQVKVQSGWHSQATVFSVGFSYNYKRREDIF